MRYKRLSSFTLNTIDLRGFYYISCWWWIFLGTRIVVPPSGLLCLFPGKLTPMTYIYNLMLRYIATKVLGYSSDLIVEDMGRVDI